MEHEGQMTDRETNDEGLPIIPPLRKPPERPADGAVAICGVCGIRIYQVMHYVCYRHDCPCFPRVTFEAER